MPIITTFETSRGRSVADAPAVPAASQSPSRSRAIITWPTISPGVRLRTKRWVPVWQNEHVSVQPTWLETHNVPRSVSGM